MPDFQPPTTALKDLGLTGFKLTFLLALVIIWVGGNALKLLHEFANVIRALFGTAGYIFSHRTMIALFSSAVVILVMTRMLDTSRRITKRTPTRRSKSERQRPSGSSPWLTSMLRRIRIICLRGSRRIGIICLRGSRSIGMGETRLFSVRGIG